MYVILAFSKSFTNIRLQPWFDGDQISNATKGTGTSTLTSSNGNASWDQRSDAFSFGLDVCEEL